MKTKFFYKHLITFMLPLLFALILMGALTVGVTQTYIKSNLNNSSQNLLRQTKENVELILGESDPMSLVYGNSSKVLQAVGSILRNRSLNPEELIAFDIIDSFMSAPADARPYIDSFYLYLSNGNGRFLSSKDGLSTFTNFYDTGWYNSYLHKASDVSQWIETREVTPYSFEDSPKRIISIFRRIDAPNGVLVLNIKPDYIEQQMKALSTMKEQSVLVMDSDNRVVFSDGTGDYLGDAALRRTIVDSAQPSLTVATDQDSYVVSKLHSDRYGWNYISIVPQSALYQVPVLIIKLTVALLVLSVVIGFTFALTMTRRNYRQISGIIRIIQLAENERPLPSTVPRYTDEYGLIVHKIVKTFLEQSYLKVQLSERRYKLQAAQMIALQSQINPHFLFNTLETLNWETIALTGRPNQANSIIDHLSQILRYSLTDPQETVTIDTELENLSHYIEIQKFRYEDKFDIMWEIDPDVGDFRVMKLLFQPLVENSIYHGIKEKEAFCRIKIKVRREVNHLEMAVIDNGVGMDEEKLAMLRRRLAMDEDAVSRIGLTNTNKRIGLVYGDEYGIRINSKKGLGTAVYMKVPIPNAKLPDANGRL
ncbi:sensor histidine kinase [Paenibacillus sepulcri]|uniref:Sensor histidine kinase n=1 Tax=Paenibacillus sepulcri TaxID=359917 RepID=A0ABS7BWP3_9BACL|nr:sensor histidine kinase [Paenibacillus sepulcri]